jgi:signal transduction histidine kinase
LIVEEPVTNADGETRWFQTIKVPIVSADGKSKYVLGVSTDITERRKSEARLQEAFQKEKELGELKSRFVSMASHEFRTPLATILAVTETLSAYRKKMEDAQIDQRLSKIQDQVGHLKDVIDDVLQLAQIQAQKVVFNPVLVDLDAMCRSVLDEFQSRPNIKHELVYTCDAKLREAYLDKRLMRQIINNLMSNAVKYSPEGKTIRINLEEQDNNLIFKIQDQGIGIPEADLKHLFQPFHRADNVGTISGTGLGLVITKESVELHGGIIAVESTVGVGTTFTVTIPLAQ